MALARATIRGNSRSEAFSHYPQIGSLGLELLHRFDPHVQALAAALPQKQPAVAFADNDSNTLWSADLGQSAYAVPMTYKTAAGKQYVVIASGAATGAKLTAFALP